MYSSERQTDKERDSLTKDVIYEFISTILCRRLRPWNRYEPTFRTFLLLKMKQVCYTDSTFLALDGLHSFSLSPHCMSLFLSATLHLFILVIIKATQLAKNFQVYS